jgi:hypothetical protein
MLSPKGLERLLTSPRIGSTVLQYREMLQLVLVRLIRLLPSVDRLGFALLNIRFGRVL